MNNESDVRVSQYETNPSIAQSLLTQLDNSPLITSFINEMLGLEPYIVTNSAGRKEQRVRRVSRPLFTEEYVRRLANDLRLNMNTNISVSRFRVERTNVRVGRFIRALIADLCTHGDDNYISETTWRRILDIHDSDDNDGNYNNSNGWKRFGIEWEYKSPVTFEMVSLVKNFDEEVDQAVVFSKVASIIASNVEASFNKSFAANDGQTGVLMSALSMIRNESATINNPQVKEKKSFFGLGGSNKNGEQTWQ